VAGTIDGFCGCGTFASARAVFVGYTSNPHSTLSRGETTVPEVHIVAQTRTEFGKGAARRIRREGLVPAVLYGHGTDTRHLTLPGHQLMLALKTPNVLLYLDGLNKGSEIALPKAVQRDPIKGFLEHVDLILVRRGEKVTVEVPLRVTGEIAPGEGMLDQQLVQIPVEAEATNIPQGIDVDVDGMEVGAAVHASDLKLPRGVSLQVDPETLILHVIARQAEEPEEEEAAEAAPEAPEAVAEQAAAAEGEQAG
jgi:large subunit ribosomal protein L25